MNISSWAWRHKVRVICTGAALTGWMAVTIPTQKMWIQKLYYKYAPNELMQPSQKTLTLINEVLMDLNAVKQDKPIDIRKVLIQQGTQPFPEYQQRGSLNNGGVFIVLTSGYDRPQLTKLLPKNFQNKLTLPESIQRYGIARQLVYSEDRYGIIKYIIGSILIVLYSIVDYISAQYVISAKLLEKTKDLVMYKRMVGRFLIFSRMPVLVAAFMNVYWAILYGYSRHVEKAADEFIATMGEKYVIGGADFYKKAIETNSKKRKMGLHYKITNEGNFVSGRIHQKTLPLTKRLTYFEDLLKKNNIQRPVIQPVVTPETLTDFIKQ